MMDKKINTNNYLNNQSVILSIIIVNYGKSPYLYLENCLKSIFCNKIDNDFFIETIVVDNSADVKTVNRLKKLYPQVIFKYLLDNLGFAKAANCGISMSRGKYILVLNNDILFRKNTLAEIKKFFYSNIPFAIAGLQLLNEDGTIQFSKGKYPTIRRITAGILKPNYKKKWDVINYDKISLTDWVSAAAVLINKNDIACGINFDEQYFLYYEDVDLCFNIKKAGGKILYVPSIKVYHLNPFHIKKNINKRVYYEIRKSQLYFFYKNYGFISYAALKSLSIIFILFIIAVSCFAKIFNKKYSSVCNVYKYIFKQIITGIFSIRRKNN